MCSSLKSTTILPVSTAWKSLIISLLMKRTYSANVDQQWSSKLFSMEAKLTPDFEPFVEEYLYPSSVQYLEVKDHIASQCAEVDLGEAYHVECGLLSLSSGSVWTKFEANVSSTDARALRTLSPYHLRDQLGKQVDMFRIVFLETDFNSQEESKRWQMFYALIMVSVFVTVLLFAALYVATGYKMSKRESSNSRKRVTPKMNSQLSKEMDLVKEQRKEQKRLDAEDKVEQEVQMKAFLVEEFKRKQELQAMKANLRNEAK